MIYSFLTVTYFDNLEKKNLQLQISYVICVLQETEEQEKNDKWGSEYNMMQREEMYGYSEQNRDSDVRVVSYPDGTYGFEPEEVMKHFE